VGIDKGETMTTIGIFGPSDDQEVKALRKRLLNRGVKPIVIDLSGFPEALPITITRDDIIIDDKSLFDIHAAFLRSRGIKVPEFARYDEKFIVDSPEKWRRLYPQFIMYVQSEVKCQKVRNSILKSFSKKRPLVNPLLKNDLHRLKTFLFWYLKKNGLPVPSFMIGTSSKNLKVFAEEAFKGSNGAVTKPLAGIYKTFLWGEMAWESHKWDERGAFYQYYIKGDTIRCYVLDGKVIASAIIVHRDTVDSSMSQTGIKVIELPERAKRIAERVTKVLELPFCGMDLMREEETGKYYVIDCNISPMFVNFARLSHNDISAKIADYLIECAQSGDRAKTRGLSLLDEVKEILENDPDIRKMISRKG
jgi:glutathione synthase/RimK-type ligase-like ATP-grasp enzyme